MGQDYIRRNTGKPWRKRWKSGVDQIKQPTLLDPKMNDVPYVVTAELDCGAEVSVGDSLIVESEGDDLAVTKGLRRIGRIRHPATECTGAVTDGSGYAEGVVESIGQFSDTVELVLK